MNNLLSSSALSAEQCLEIFKRTSTKSKESSFSFSPVGVLAFFEPSTRTRLSFEMAGLRLGMKWLSLHSGDLSIEKGETLKDTFQALSKYKPDVMVVRHSKVGTADLVSSWTKIPVINAGDGSGDHPTQGLLDAFTLYKLDPRKKWKIALFGDVYKSRVARADIQIFTKLGFKVFIVNDGSSLTKNFAEAFQLPLMARKDLSKMDAVQVLRVQKERGSELLQSPLCPEDLSSKTLLMHPGPVIWGQDLHRDFEKDPRSLIMSQVEAGFEIRKTLLQMILEKKSK